MNFEQHYLPERRTHLHTGRGFIIISKKARSWVRKHPIFGLNGDDSKILRFRSAWMDISEAK